MKKNVSLFFFDKNLAEKISALVCEGNTVQKIGKSLGIPPHVIYRWQRECPEFEKSIKAAREDRSHYYHDKIIEIAESDLDYNELKLAKLKVDIYKWAAKVGNKIDFGEKTSSNNSPLSQKVYIFTGIKK